MGGNNRQRFDVYLITKVNVRSGQKAVIRGRRVLGSKYDPWRRLPISSSSCVTAQVPEKPPINQCQGSGKCSDALAKPAPSPGCRQHCLHP